MLNKEKLEEKISESGKKYNYLAKKIGITEQSFKRKRKGMTNFTIPEVDALCKELGITDGKELQAIFFA